MDRNPHNRKSSGSPPPDTAERETHGDSLAYLQEGAIVPPIPPRTFPRTNSRRGFVASALAAIGATAWFGAPLNTAGAFFPGTMVGDLNIAELEHHQALALMKTHFADFENTAVDFTFEQQRWNAGLAQLGFAIDYEATLASAWQHGRESSHLAQFRAVMIRPEEQSYPVLFTVNDEKLTAHLKDIGTQIMGAAHDASLYLDGDQVRVQPNEDGRALDITAAADATRRSVQSAQRNTVELVAQSVISQITAEMLEPKRNLAQTMINAPVRLRTGDDIWQVSQSTLRSALVLPERGVLAEPTFNEKVIGDSLDEIASAVATQSADATLGWDDGLVVVAPDVRGRTLNITATVQAVLAAARTADERDVEAQFTEILAEARSDNLHELGIADLIATGDSNFDGSAWERAENVRISAEHLTHTLVRPGGTYSFNQAIGPITLDNGFVQGKIIRGTRIVEDIGGGACQASTTVFRAALKAGFPIDHEFHQYRLQMYEHDGWPPGLDAAIFQPDDPSDWELDLQFTNSTDQWILVEFYIDEIYAYCKIYGTPQGWDVNVEVPYISAAKQPEAPIETEDASLAKGDRQQVGFATNGYDVQAIRTITRNGETVKFDDMPNPWEFWSYFQPQRDEFLIGPGTKRELDTDKTKPTATIEG